MHIMNPNRKPRPDFIEAITVGEVRRLIAGLPDDAEVYIKDEDGQYSLADWAESQLDQDGECALAIGIKSDI